MTDFPINPQAFDPLATILQAGKLILEWTKGVNEHRLWEDKRTRAAVERQFEVMAEALYRLHVIDRWTRGKLTDSEVVMRLGDAIRRDYDHIDYGILWRATRKELPTMMREVEGLLAKKVR
jgi:uncharacterized protein with HEPN domain